jgi:hypothetical protein
MPRQGRRAPWRIRNDYLRDAPVLRRGRVADPALQFTTDRSDVLTGASR